jgi:hypothetical protein
MKKRGLAGLIFVLLLLPLLLTGCPVEDEDTNKDKPPPVVEPEPEPYIPVAIGNYTGTGSGTGNGFGNSPAHLEDHGFIGKPITVTVTMEAGWIKTVNIDGPDESAGFGAVLVDTLPAKIKEYNTFDLSNLVDGLSSASYTYRGIKEGGEKAIEVIKNLP